LKSLKKRRDAPRMSLLESHHLDLPDRATDPFGRVWLAGAQKNLGHGLRKHRLSLMAIDGFHLAPTLKPEHETDVGFAPLSERHVQLREALETGQFVQNKPHRRRSLSIHESEN